MFPRFRAKFFFGWELGSTHTSVVGDTVLLGEMSSTPASVQGNRPALKTLDLGALTGSKEDG
jgi:hypothetical protein